MYLWLARCLTACSMTLACFSFAEARPGAGAAARGGHAGGSAAGRNLSNTPAGVRNTTPAARTTAASGQVRSNLATQAGQYRPQLSATQQQNVQTLVTDLQAMHSKSQVTPEQKQQLKNDLMAMADGATKPSQASVQKLATDMQAAWSDQKLSPKEQYQLTADVAAVLNSANIPASEVQAALTDAQAILQASGLNQADAQKIVADLKAIAAEGKANHPKP